jgi:hypothetical protein
MTGDTDHRGASTSQSAGVKHLYGWIQTEMSRMSKRDPPNSPEQAKNKHPFAAATFPLSREVKYLQKIHPHIGKHAQ